jgi:hypothetical protein
LAATDFCPFPKINSALKGRRFQFIEGTENYSTSGVPETIPKVAASFS